MSNPEDDIKNTENTDASETPETPEQMADQALTEKACG